MRHIFFSLLFLVVSTLSMAQMMPSANAPDYRNVLKMSAALFTRNTFQMGFERFINSNTSVYVNAGLNFKDSDYEKEWGVRAEAQMRFHVFTVINPTSSHRLYFAPYLMNHYLTLENRNYDYISGNEPWKSDTFDAVNGGMLFGWSYTFANRINLDVYTGGGLRKTFNYDDNNYYNDVFDYGYSGIVPRLGVEIGFWF